MHAERIEIGMSYIDTSVLVALYCPERLSEAVQKAMKRIGAPAISALVEVEFSSALAVKVRTGEMDAATARKIAAVFRQHVNEGYYRIVPLGEREFATARDWIGQFSTALRALDALHLAAAFNGGFKIITADKGLAKAAGYFGVGCKVIG